MSEIGKLPTEGLIDLGLNHWMKFAYYEDEKPIGISDYHLRPDGTLCAGFISFTGGAWAEKFKDYPNKNDTWEVLQFEPLTLSPSLLCRACGDHGFIENGKWRKA